MLECMLLFKWKAYECVGRVSIGETVMEDRFGGACGF